MTATKLKIRLYGDPCLRKKSLPIKEVGPNERILIQSMIDSMHEHKGIGLAAPQIGLNIRLFVVDIGDGPIAIINPLVKTKSGSDTMEEGCLSIPEVVLNIKRPTKILLRYLNENNEEVEKKFEDLLARVILHETDHLNGKLITDYASIIEKTKLRKQLKEIQKDSGI